MKILAGKKAGFTGTREGLTLRQNGALSEVLRTLAADEAHHGDCIGADSLFHAAALSLWIPHIYIHPPLDEKYRAHCKQYTSEHTQIIELPPLDYLHRNKRIVMRCPSYLIACPAQPQEILRSGTWSTVRFARSRAVPHRIIVEPSGKVREEN